MTSAAFNRALQQTGYQAVDGTPAPGLSRAGDHVTSRLRPALLDDRVRLRADAVFTAQNNPTTIFKDSGEAHPTEQQISSWHEAAWNIGVAPLLWIVTPTDIRLYDCYSSPPKEDLQGITRPLEVFSLASEDRLRELNRMCGRFATETGAFWSSPIGQRIDRRHRVDRELLSEIKELEEQLTALPAATGEPQARSHVAIKQARDFAQRLIGRCIFTSYLIDRGVAQPFLPDNLPHDVSGMFADVETAFSLFKWLRATFNGDLFPMNDPGAEHQRLSAAHLKLLRDFSEGTSLVSRQGRLFRFRYDAIPVDLISSIYQQFARSSAEEEARVQGLHYTPVELVHLTLDPVFEQLPENSRVIDPTCGSGAFLVEAFRRLVWKKAKGKPATRQLVRDVLYGQLYGIDINRSALGIAAFSLYLAALELDEDPVEDILDLKFDKLIGTTLFEADTINDDLPEAILKEPFDAVVGNPPWTFVGKSKVARRRKPGVGTRPRRSPDQEFLWVAARLAGSTGRIGMILKATPFFSNDPLAVEARQALLHHFMPVALVNLSALRKEGLFPGAKGPALLFFARHAMAKSNERLLVGSVPWTADFHRNGVFQIGPADFKTVSLERVLRAPSMLKATTFGTVRDGWLIEKLNRYYPTLEEVLQEERLDRRGQGFKLNGDVMYAVPKEYFKLSILDTDHYTPFRISAKELPPFRHKALHRERNPKIFNGPLLICPKAAAQTGRYSVAYCAQPVLYNESFYGISFKGRDRRVAKVLSAILNSSLTTFQLAFGGGTWGLERPTIEPVDLLSLRIPRISSVAPEVLQAVIDAEAAAAEAPEDAARLVQLDTAVCALYGLESDETTIIEECIERARMLSSEARKQRLCFTAGPTPDALTAYAGEVITTVNAYLRARGKRHLQATIYSQRLTPRDVSSPGVTAVRFAMVPGAPTQVPTILTGNAAEVSGLAAALSDKASATIPYLNERRQLRVYQQNDLFVLKPSEVRYWTRTSGLNDADAILADHWMQEAHAVHA